MLRVIVEIHPFLKPDEKRAIAQLDIANISELQRVSSYRIEATLEDKDGKSEKRKVIVKGHMRSLGWGPLVQRAIGALGLGV